MEHLIWPAAVVLLAGFVIWLTREPLRRLVDRITSVDKSGIHAAPQQAIVAEEGTKAVSSQDLMELNFNSVIAEQEGLLREALSKIDCSLPGSRESLLLRALARAVVASQFERTSMLIYGSQLELVVEATSRPAGIDEGMVERKFKEAKAAHSVFHERTNLESFRGFLLGNRLLIAEGDRLRITPFGKEFLKFLVDNGLTYRRPG